MGDGFTVDSEQLLTQAGTVDGLAGRAAAAKEAGAHVTSLDDAYGLLCSPFAQLLRQPQQRGVDTLEATEEVLRDLVNGLKDNARTYQEAEAKAGAALKAATAKLDAAAKAPSVRGGN